MIQTFDVGSTPFPGDYERFLKEIASVDHLIKLTYSTKFSGDRGYFEEKIVECFLDKVGAGIDIPNYPQFRDMNEMFLDSIDGIEKSKEGYMITGPTSIEPEKRQIPEVKILEERAREICVKTSTPLKVKLCLTGPYTLASLFTHRGPYLFSTLGEMISKIVETNLFDNKFGRVELVALDEPVFGLFDDPLLDYGARGREELLKTWESIYHIIKSKKVKTCIHLHGTTNELFWQIKSLDIIESHVEDPLYSSRSTKQMLEREDKFLKASIGITNFDNLIRNYLRKSAVEETALNQKIADVWTDVRKGKADSTIFLEKEEIIAERLRKIIEQFGGERVLYAGPECGLKSFPTYECAIECLRRISTVVRGFSP